MIRFNYLNQAHFLKKKSIITRTNVNVSELLLLQKTHFLPKFDNFTYRKNRSFSLISIGLLALSAISTMVVQLLDCHKGRLAADTFGFLKIHIFRLSFTLVDFSIFRRKNSFAIMNFQKGEIATDF